MKSDGDPLAFHPLSALLFLPVQFAAPKRGGLGPRAKRRNAVAAETVSLQSVLRTDAAAFKTQRKQRFLNGTAVCLNAPLALLNVALHAALTTPRRISSAGFSGSVHSTKRRDAFSFVHLHRRNTITSNAAPTEPPGNSPRLFVYAKASGPFANVRRPEACRAH